MLTPFKNAQADTDIQYCMDREEYQAAIIPDSRQGLLLNQHVAEDDVSLCDGEDFGDSGEPVGETVHGEKYASQEEQ